MTFDDQASAEPIARLSQVSLCYGEVMAIKQLNLDIHRGQVVALLGPNGAGKTSLVNLLLGLQSPSMGKAQLLGQTPGELSCRQRIGVMMQQAELADMLTVDELLQQFAGYYPAPLPHGHLLKLAGLEALSDRRYGKLSGGEKRRVQFAIAMAGNPEVLFLDEPTTGLDIEARRQLWNSIRAFAGAGRSVLLTTHYLEEADELADRIVVMRSGECVADGAPSMIKQQINLRQVRCRSNADLMHLSTHPGVREFHHQQQRLQVLTTQAESLVAALLQTDPALTELEVHGAGLEQAFIALTSDQPREAA